MKTDFWIVLLLVSGTCTLPAQDPKETKPAKSDSHDAELAAIRETSATFAADYNRGDADAIAAHWTEDGDYQDDDGQVVAGREAIANKYKEFLATQKETKLRIVIDSLRLLSPTAAVEDGRTMLDPAPDGAPAIGKYTAVHVKVDGQWKLSTVRESRVELPSGYRHVADLDWLIGSWIAEEQGAKTEYVCRWVANKSFVERTYTTTNPDGTTSSGVQLIGFNPEASRMQSWTFSPDGGHAIGIWTPREKGWSAEVRGVTGEGVGTTAVNTLERLDDDAYAWQSVERTAGGQSLADSEQIIIKRVK